MIRIQRTRRGDFRVRLPSEEREILRSLPGQLRRTMSDGGPSVRRLRPPAYTDDPLLEAEYRELVDDDLTSERLQSLAVFEETIDAERLDQEQLMAWLAAVNDMRLVLGTDLDVTEEMPADVPESDPRHNGLVLYGYLSFLEELMVQALGQGIG